MEWYTVAVFPVLIFAFWMYTALITQQIPTLQGQKILLLIAHPDDEAMFFAPTLLSLTRPDLRNHIKIMCLSSGDAEGLGETRKKELVKSAKILGIRSEDDVLIIEDAAFPDSMTKDWDAKLISKMLTTVFAPKMASFDAKAAPEANIDVLITFDAHGVSGHPNHRSLFHGSVAFLKSLMSGRSGWECPVALYTLSSTSVVRKYLGIFDALLTLLLALYRGTDTGDKPAPLLAISSVFGWMTAQKAMTTAHVSQMRWFRWGWIVLSRYMTINDLRKVKLKS